MIKNEQQAQRAAEKLIELHDQVEALRNEYAKEEFVFWASAILDEINQIGYDLYQYKLLSKLSLEEAVNGPLQEPILLENIGELLSKLRIAAKMTQSELGEILAWDQPNVSRFESENYSSQTIAKISEYLGALGVWLYVVPSVSEKPRRNMPIIRRETKERGFFNKAVSLMDENVSTVHETTSNWPRRSRIEENLVSSSLENSPDFVSV